MITVERIEEQKCMITLKEAMEMYENGYCLEINDGKAGNFVREDEGC